MRRRAIVGSMAVLAASALVVGMSATVAGAGGKKAPPLCAGKTKKQAIKNINTAYKYFLDYGTAPTAQDKEPYIEYLSGKTASPALIAEFEAPRVRVRVRKLHVPIDGFTGIPEVAIERARS